MHVGTKLKASKKLSSRAEDFDAPDVREITLTLQRQTYNSESSTIDLSYVESCLIFQFVMTFFHLFRTFDLESRICEEKDSF